MWDKALFFKLYQLIDMIAMLLSGRQDINRLQQLFADLDS
jgi:hypothetical protein